MYNGRVSVDVLVVGAGPAGLMAARKIAAAGFKVLVVEKEKELSVKPCGEGISARTIKTAELTDKEADRFIAVRIKRANIYSPSGIKLSVVGGSAQGYIIDKKKFLRVMASKAADAGAEIAMAEPAKRIEKVDEGYRIYTRSLEVTTRLLIGADGYLSFTARRLGLEKPGERKVIPTVQYVMVNCNLEDPEAIDFYVGRRVAPLGYVWVFPKSETEANVGIGVRGAPAKLYLDKFVRDHPEMFSKAEVVEYKGSAVTISGMLEKIVDDNVMLVGEAAGEVIPLTGGGIHSSIAGGGIASETAIGALEKDDLSAANLSGYVKRYGEYWGKRIKDSLKAQRAIEELSDRELDALAKAISPEEVVDLANGINMLTIAKKLLKHPMLGVKLAMVLLKAT